MEKYLCDTDYNFLDMIHKGKYKIPKKKFWKIFRQVYKQSGFINVVRADYMTPTFDFDIILKQNVEIPNDRLLSLALVMVEAICTHTQQCNDINIYGLRKEENTPKGHLFKAGMHLIIHGLKISQSMAHDIRSDFLATEFVHDFCEEFEVVDQSELIDDKVAPVGKNGLFIAPQVKPGRPKGYYCFYKCNLMKRIPENQIGFEEAEGREYTLENVEKIYKHIFPHECDPVQKFPCSIVKFGAVAKNVADIFPTMRVLYIDNFTRSN